MPADGRAPGLMLEILGPGSAGRSLVNHGYDPSPDPEVYGPGGRLVFIAEQAGDYHFRVVGFDRDAIGAWRLSIERLSPPPAPASYASGRSEPARGWRIWEGRIEAGDPDDASGRRYDNYLVPMTAGRPVLVMVERTYPAGTPAGERYEGGFAVQIARPEDREAVPGSAAPPVPARLLGSSSDDQPAWFTPDRTGPYLFRVIAGHREIEGGYRLRITE